MTTTDQRTAPEATTLAKMTVAAICLDVSRAAQSECGLDGCLTPDMVTWAIVMNAGMVDAYPPKIQRQLIERLKSAAHCGDTAKTLFLELKTNATGVGVFGNLALHVMTAAKARRRVAFHVRFLNHEFLVVVRDGQAELFQSFHDLYTLGDYLMMPSTPYPPGLLQCYLGSIALPFVQQQIFLSPPLDTSSHRAEYDYAVLKSDKEIWEALFKKAVCGVARYRSLFNEVILGQLLGSSC